MKVIRNTAIIGTFALVIMACSSGDREKNRKMEDASDMAEEMLDAAPEPVEISIEELVGTWKYAEVRLEPLEEGTPPMGEILLGITEDYTLTHATAGIDELKYNLRTIPSKFEIKDNKLCPTDKLSEMDFNMTYQNKEVSCYLLNENELVFGKGLRDGSPAIYMYYSRVE